MNHLKISAFIKSVEDETNPYIFKGSQTRFKHFAGLCQKIFTYLKIDERIKDILVLLFRAVLPLDSCLENIHTYKSLVKIFEHTDVEERRVCGICS